jgi:hypothetical protein
MFYERPFHGPFSKKIEKGIENKLGEFYLKRYSLMVIDYLDEFFKENFHEKLHETCDVLLSCARFDVKKGRYEWALDDVSTIEDFVNKIVPEKLDAVGDGGFKVIFEPYDPEDTTRKHIVTSSDGRFYAVSLELDPRLKEDEFVFVPESSSVEQ